MTTPYYEADGIVLYHGDCREVTEWLAADVLVTDPPYGVSYEGAGPTARVLTIANDHDFGTTHAVIGLWGRRPMAVFANHASLPDTLSSVRGLHERTRVAVWHKTNINGGSPGNPWLADVEFIVCGVPEWPKVARSALMSARRFTGNPAFNASPDAYLHPTQKNVRVMEMVLQAMPRGVVADPFAGSGSTLIAARAQGLRAIGVEVEERYCEVVASRLSQGDLFGGAA